MGFWSDTKQASAARNEPQSVYKVNSSEEDGFCLLGYPDVLSLCSSGLKKKKQQTIAWIKTRARNQPKNSNPYEERFIKIIIIVIIVITLLLLLAMQQRANKKEDLFSPLLLVKERMPSNRV